MRNIYIYIYIYLKWKYFAKLTMPLPLLLINFMQPCLTKIYTFYFLQTPNFWTVA